MESFIENLETNDGDFHWRSALDSNDWRLAMMRTIESLDSRLTDGLATCNRHLLNNVVRSVHCIARHSVSTAVCIGERTVRLTCSPYSRIVIADTTIRSFSQSTSSKRQQT